MNTLIDLIKQYFVFEFAELLAGLCGLIVALSVYHLFNLWLSGKIRSVFIRRTMIWLLALILFSIYYFLFETGRGIEVRERDMRIFWVAIVNSFVCFNLYYIFSHKLSEQRQWWVSFVRFSVMFLMFWLFMANMDFLVNYFEDNSRGYTENFISNFHLSEEERIYFFKRNIVFNIVVALEATVVDYACRYVIRLQQLRQKEKELETLKLKEQLTQAHLDALHAKINPHFLYNSLNSIAGLALTDGLKTRQMAVSLSKFFRYSINREQSNLATLYEEMEMVETYLEIEKVRFEDLLNYEISIEPGLENLRIPRFILQPLVENSVKHGMKGDLKELLIRVCARRDDKKLSLSVHDNGLPFPGDIEPSYGLKSVHDKLDLLFPEKYEVALINNPEKRVSILIEI